MSGKCPRLMTTVICTVVDVVDKKSNLLIFSLGNEKVNIFPSTREADYYRKSKEEGGPKKDKNSLLSKQFSLRRGSGGSDETPTITPEELEAIRKSRLTAAESTSVKIAGLKITVSSLFFISYCNI